MALAYARFYILAWGFLCLVALLVGVQHRKSLAISRRAYWIGLSRRWKLATFTVAFLGIVLVAPRSGDPTWDYWDAAFMAVLTYVTAPWTLGVIVRAFRRRSLRHTTKVEVYVAVCVWLFSASFSYDIYLFLRDHHYPVTWWSNLLASSGLYGCGGAMWSLRGQGTASERQSARAVTFAFMRDDWPASLADGSVKPLLPYIAFFMLCVLAMLGPFLWVAATSR